MTTVRPLQPPRRLRQALCIVLSMSMLAGCQTGEKQVRYIGKRDLDYYKDVATEISFPTVEDEPSESVAFSKQPRTLRDRLVEDEIWDMSLTEAIHLSLLNNKILRVGGDFATQSGVTTQGSRILSQPEGAISIYDPAIQESGVLFGNRGVESALAAFDTQFTTGLILGSNELVQNQAAIFGGGFPGNTFTQHTGSYIAQLQKQTATGATLGLSNTVEYERTNSPNALFPSVYRGNVRADFRQPLWAGAGTEFTRIAGPGSQNINGVSGVNQGVLIARINGDISIADFEANVTNMLFDAEKAYWDLYNAYRQYDTAVANRNSALQSWRKVETLMRFGGKGGGAAEEAQAREAYFQRRATEEFSLRNIDTQEIALRRMCGLPVNDGRIIRPADEPVTAEFVPDWHASLAETLTRHVNLRRQKWSIKSLDLQLSAAKSLTNPRLDLVSSYQVNGFGDNLFGQNDNDAETSQGFNSAIESLTQGNQTGWSSGLQFSMPLGFRNAHAQVRNIELRLAKAREILETQEEELSYELARTFQDLALHWQNTQTNFNRRRAAERQVQAFQAEYTAGTKTIDLLLAAQARLADAENAYYNSLVEYTKTITTISYRKGTLLELNNVHLSEGQWDPEAYREALRRAWARSYAFDAKRLHHEPPAFAIPGPAGTADYTVSPLEGERLPAAPPATGYDQAVPPPAPPANVPPPEAPEAAPAAAAAERKPAAEQNPVDSMEDFLPPVPQTATEDLPGAESEEAQLE